MSDKPADGQDHPGKHLRPPWKPGQSGNPGGRPKGKSLLSEIREAMDSDQLLGKPNPGGRTNRRLLAETAIMHAVKGRSAYLRMILEYFYGRPVIRIEQKSISDDGTADVRPEVIEAMLAAGLAAADTRRGDKE